MIRIFERAVTTGILQVARSQVKIILLPSTAISVIIAQPGKTRFFPPRFSRAVNTLPNLPGLTKIILIIHVKGLKSVRLGDGDSIVILDP